MSEEPITFRVIYHGRVQGVGFRFTVWTLSKGFQVGGYVKNLPDGTVEMIAQCTESVFERFDSAIQARFDGNVTSADASQLSQESETEAFTSFQIR